MKKDFGTSNRMNTPQELFRIWNYQQRQIAKDCISKAEREKKTITKQEFLLKLAQVGYKLSYRNVVFEIDEEIGWSILTVGNKKIFGATLSDMFAMVKKLYGKTPNFDNLKI